MKKFFLFALLVSVVAFASCSKDDDDDEIFNSLSGTTWEYTEDGILESLSFSDTQCKWTLKYASSSSNYKTTMFEYTYNHPKVTLKPLENGLAIMEGEVSGSAMTLTNTSTGKQIGIFINNKL